MDWTTSDSARRIVRLPIARARTLRRSRTRPASPCPSGGAARSGAVVEEVVVDELGFVLETSSAVRDLALRGIDRDVVVALSIEDGDVFGLAGGFRVGQRIEPARVDLGEEVARTGQQRPRVAAQIAEVNQKRLLRILPQHFLVAAEFLWVRA